MGIESTFDPNLLFDATISDPPYLDPEFPPEQFVTHFMSQGSVVHATVWIAQGAALRGTAILSPQIFGGDRLESLIIPMMASGFNVMTFHPRGMWDNQHAYSLMSAVDDARAAAAFIHSTAEPGARTPKGNNWRTDPARIAVMGLSGGGGNVALTACAEDPLIQSAIAIAANSMVAISNADGIAERLDFFNAVKALTAGRIDMEKMMVSMTPADHERLSPIVHAPRLVDKNILLVGAHLDSVSTIETCHKPMAQAMRDAGVKGFNEVILASDHAFLTARIALSRLVVGWLRGQCGF